MFILNNDSKTQYIVLSSMRWASLKLMRKDLQFWASPEEDKRSPMVKLKEQGKYLIYRIITNCKML